METGGMSALQIIFWILAANTILILSIFGLTAWLRQQTKTAVQKLARLIQGFDNQLAEFGGFFQSYRDIDQEPFFTPLDELRSETSQIEIRINQYLAVCHDFEEEIKQTGGNQLQNIINAPIVWYRRWGQSRALRREGNEIAAQMAEIETRIQHVFELPWELAAECRLARTEAAELSQHTQWLQSRGIRGAALSKAASQVPLINQELERVPADYYTAEKDELLASTNSAATIQVFDRLHNVRPAINRYLPLVREWRASYEKASAEYASLKQAGANLRTAFGSPPPGLDLGPLQDRLDQVAQMASELSQRLAQPEVDDLKPLAREINRLHRVLQDIAQQFTRAGEGVISLNQTLTKLQEGLGSLSAQFKALEESGRHPLVWDESRSALDSLQSQLARLGPAQQPRTPEQIQQQRGSADKLMAEFKALAEKAPLVIKRHTALVELLDSQPVQDGPLWLRQARAAAAGAALYDAKNWPKQVSLASLSQELDELERLQSRLVPSDPAAPVFETQLGQLLQDAQQLAALHKSLRPRVESLCARLEKIQSMEKEGKEKLTGAWNVLERVALLAESNQRLDEIISGEIDRLGDEIRALGDELNAHQQGEIEKKAQKIQAQAGRVTQALNQWLASLNNAIAERIRQTGDLLARLDVAANIDDQPAAEARELLKRAEVIAMRSEPAPGPAPKKLVERVASRLAQAEAKTDLDDLSALAEIKRKNDLWQTILAVQTALEEISAPLLAANQEAVQARSEARELLVELAKKLPERRAWPPSSQPPLKEQEVLRGPDEKRERMRKQPVHAEWAARELARLAGEYRLAAEHVRQVQDRVDQDHERIQELEWQINSLKERWQAQVEPDNPIMREGVQQLLSQADSGLSAVKQQYMQGILSYEEVIRSLQLLYDKIFIAQVPVDAANKVGLNEPRPRTEQRKLSE